MSLYISIYIFVSKWISLAISSFHYLYFFYLCFCWSIFLSLFCLLYCYYLLYNNLIFFHYILMSFCLVIILFFVIGIYVCLYSCRSHVMLYYFSFLAGWPCQVCWNPVPIRTEIILKYILGALTPENMCAFPVLLPTPGLNNRGHTPH